MLCVIVISGAGFQGGEEAVGSGWRYVMDERWSGLGVAFGGGEDE